MKLIIFVALLPLMILPLMILPGIVFGESDSLNVSFENNAAPQYNLELHSNEKIILEQSYSWVRDQNSRYNLVSYSIDGNEPVPINRQARGTFSFDVPANSKFITFSSVVQYPVSITGVNNYSFLPKSPTNDNWFDEKSEILILHITSENSGIIPNVITKVEGQIMENSGNSVQILVDNPIHLTIHWESDYSIFAILLLFPIIGIVIFFIRQKKGSNSPKTVPKPEKTIPKLEKTVPKTNSNDYENEIKEFLKQKSIKKIDSLIASKTITPEKGIRIKDTF